MSRNNNSGDRLNPQDFKVAEAKIWKMLHNPKYLSRDETGRVVYSHHLPEDLKRDQMARRADRKVIKLETAFGSERNWLIVKRNQDLVVRNVMEDVEKQFKIPIDQQVIFHKGKNLCDTPNESLEALGVENNNLVRITNDPTLPSRSPRNKMSYINTTYSGQYGAPNGYNDMTSYGDPYYMQQHQAGNLSNRGGGSLNNISNTYQQQYPASQPQGNGFNDVLKLYVSYGSEREYVLVNGRKPLSVYDLKQALFRHFRIVPEQQCIVFKGYNLHDYIDETPLDAFGLENNSPISFWFKLNSNPQPSGMHTTSNVDLTQSDVYSARNAHPLTLPPIQTSYNSNVNDANSNWMNAGGDGNLSPRGSTEVIKLEVQHGSDRHQILMKSVNRNVTIQDLQNELEKVTTVPLRDQRLFFKAQELNQTPFKTLKEYDIDNNSVIKLVGDPAKWKYQNYFGRVAPTNSEPGTPGNVGGGAGAGFDPSAAQLQQMFNPQKNMPPSSNYGQGNVVNGNSQPFQF